MSISGQMMTTKNDGRADWGTSAKHVCDYLTNRMTFHDAAGSTIGSPAFGAGT